MRFRAPRKLRPAEPKQLALVDTTRREPFSRRTFMPVRRDSFPAGECEQDWFRPLSNQDRRGLVHAALAYNQAFKIRGDRFGPLGANGPAVLDALLQFMDRTSGWLDPALDTIAAKLNVKRATVIAALSRLRAHGFAQWIRRFVRTGAIGMRGPQVEQTSNAYKLSVPDKARRLLPWRFKPPRVPDCEAHHHAARAAAAEAMRVDPAVNPLAASLASAGAALEARDARHQGGENASPLKGPQSP